MQKRRTRARASGCARATSTNFLFYFVHLADDVVSARNHIFLYRFHRRWRLPSDWQRIYPEIVRYIICRILNKLQMMNEEKHMEKKLPLPFHVNETRKIKRYTPQRHLLNLTRHMAAAAAVSRFWFEIHSNSTENGTHWTPSTSAWFRVYDRLE